MRKAQLLALTLMTVLLLAASTAYACVSTRCDGVTGGCLTDTTITPDDPPKKKGKG